MRGDPEEISLFNITFIANRNTSNLHILSAIKFFAFGQLHEIVVVILSAFISHFKTINMKTLLLMITIHLLVSEIVTNAGHMLFDIARQAAPYDRLQ